jgi:hypothetical protein
LKIIYKVTVMYGVAFNFVWRGANLDQFILGINAANIILRIYLKSPREVIRPPYGGRFLSGHSDLRIDAQSQFFAHLFFSKTFFEIRANKSHIDIYQ